jgi:hypothetical protein
MVRTASLIAALGKAASYAGRALYHEKVSALANSRVRMRIMVHFRPKYVTFDCYGTLINFQMAEAAHDLYGAILPKAGQSRP